MWTKFFPAVSEVRRLIEAGTIGDVVSVHADFAFSDDPVDGIPRIWRRAHAGGGLLDVGIYPLAMASMVFGGRKPASVVATGALREGIDATGGAVLRYDNKRALRSGGGDEGDDVLDGGEGIDKAIFSGTSSDYSITINQDGSIAVVDSVKSRDGADSLLQVERVNFADTSLAFDIAGNAGAGYRIYKAAFDREPDHAGLGYWIDKLDEGADLAADVASGFLVSAEFEALYGSNTTDEAFVENLYENVLKRAPDEGGSRYWQDLLNAGEQRANILRNFSESNENIDQVADLVGQGITYIEYLG